MNRYTNNVIVTMKSVLGVSRFMDIVVGVAAVEGLALLHARARSWRRAWSGWDATS